MPATIASTVRTSWRPGGPSINAASSRRPSAPGPASGAKKRAMRSNSPRCRSATAIRSEAMVGIVLTQDARQAIEHAVHHSRLLAGEKGMRDVKIFADDDARRHVGAAEKLIGAGPQDGAQDRLQPLQRPLLAQRRREHAVDLALARRGAAHDVREEGAVGFAVILALDLLAEPVLDEFGDHRADRGAAARLDLVDLDLVKRLNGEKPGDAATPSSSAARGGGRHGIGHERDNPN